MPLFGTLRCSSSPVPSLAWGFGGLGTHKYGKPSYSPSCENDRVVKSLEYRMLRLTPTTSGKFQISEKQVKKPA